MDTLTPDDDLEGLKENHSMPSTPRTPSMDMADLVTRARRSPTKQPEPRSQDMLKLAAKTVSSTKYT